MKILTIVGARPQFIKAGALSRAIKKYPEIQELILHTGQHFDENMSEVFFREMEIPKPDFNLEVNGLSHGAMTGRMLEGIEKVIQEQNPDYVLVYGDTNSTLAGALAAVKIHVPIIHVEAGLRSFNMAMPEEVNRILTDRVSQWLFCPTQTAIDNLKNEGFDHFSSQIVLSGDVMQDAALFYAQKAGPAILNKLGLTPSNYVLSTLHRAENTDDPNRLSQIVDALNTIHNEIPVVLPLHPRTKKIIESQGLHPRFIVIDPVGYVDMISLTSNSRLVITDSGGLQKEAYFFNKFCITTRDQTEWVELVNVGANTLVGADKEHILKAWNTFKNENFTADSSLYGGGKACDTICRALLAGKN
ncbi:MAG: UDP-N-acetylglucosamine 2-epimerase (non-hydrolyzing) [Bacteroidia bacterium]|nr:UDP-N-acetylglucosamine 2-epimerase (non-hydrolyzing) [Bacteroidia bacterium]